jgi:hypothetical protein
MVANFANRRIQAEDEKVLDQEDEGGQEMTLIFILMIGSILYLFVDNYYSKQRIELLRERVRDLEFITSPKGWNK